MQKDIFIPICCLDSFHCYSFHCYRDQHQLMLLQGRSGSWSFFMDILWTVALDFSSPSVHIISLQILVQQLVEVGINSSKKHFHFFFKQCSILITFIFFKQNIPFNMESKFLIFRPKKLHMFSSVNVCTSFLRVILLLMSQIFLPPLIFVLFCSASRVGMFLSQPQGCQTHFPQGSHQPRGWLQRAKYNFRTVWM